MADKRSRDLSDARSLDHLSHREQLLEVARRALSELDLHYGPKQKKRARDSKRHELDQAFARLSGEPLTGIGPIRGGPRLDPSDPRHVDHPSHEEQYLEFAREIGRMMAMVGGDGLLFSEADQRKFEEKKRKLEDKNRRRRAPLSEGHRAVTGRER